MALRLGLFLIWAGVSMFLQVDPVNGDHQLSEDYFIPLEEMEHTASGAETKDDECVFPFTYGNKKYFDCTFHGSIFRWCSLDADYAGRWKYCTKRDYAKCVFPFIYEGKSHNTCIITGSITMSYWCSLSPNYDQDGVWKYC